MLCYKYMAFRPVMRPSIRKIKWLGVVFSPFFIMLTDRPVNVTTNLFMLLINMGELNQAAVALSQHGDLLFQGYMLLFY